MSYSVREKLENQSLVYVVTEDVTGRVVAKSACRRTALRDAAVILRAERERETQNAIEKTDS